MGYLGVLFERYTASWCRFYEHYGIHSEIWTGFPRYVDPGNNKSLIGWYIIYRVYGGIYGVVYRVYHI